MAKFSTSIPNEAAEFIKSLSKRASLINVVLNPETYELVVLWENEDLHTGLTVPVEWPLNKAKVGKLPSKTYKASDRPKAPVPLPAKQNAPETKPEAKATAPVYLSEQQVNEMAKKGEAIEYMGVFPRWTPFNPRVDKYTSGYFYRPKAKALDAKPVAS